MHQLRHSALTHLDDEGVSAVLLHAKSRYHDPCILACSSKPGIEAVALTAQPDRGGRHRP